MDTSSCSMEHQPLDVDLGCKLKIDDGDEQESQPQPPIRNLRRRLPPKPVDKPNRRVQMKPTKRKDTENAENTVKYLKRTNSLETIFEEPKNGKKLSNTLIGGRKLIRAINFSTGGQYSNDKIKKRRKRIKRFLGKSMRCISKKMDMATFLKNLKEMTEDDDIPSHTENLL